MSSLTTISCEKRFRAALRRWAIALLLVLLSTSTSWADEHEVEARQAYEAGFAASEAKDFELALSHYQNSYSLLPRPRTMYNMAHCEEELGRGIAAIEHFELFLRIATDREEDYRPLAEARIVALKRTFYGLLSIKSKPSRAEVFVDGGARGVGRTPLELPLPPGEHELTLVAKGNRPVLRKVDVVAGERTTEVVNLKTPRVKLEVPAKDAPVGALLVQSYRAGATVSIDGRVIGLTQHSDEHEVAAVRANVVPGRHLLTIELGSSTLRKRVDTAPGELVTISMKSGGHSVLHSKGFLWTLAGVGAASVIAGGGLGLHSLKRGGSSDSGEQDAARTQALLGDLLVLGGSGALLGAWALGRQPGSSLNVSRSLLPSDEGEGDAP